MYQSKTLHREAQVRRLIRAGKALREHSEGRYKFKCWVTACAQKRKEARARHKQRLKEHKRSSVVGSDSNGAEHSKDAGPASDADPETTDAHVVGVGEDTGAPEQSTSVASQQTRRWLRFRKKVR